MENACNYYLKSIGATFESVSNNISESFNNVLKRHQDWKEVTVDALVLVLYKLQNAYNAQILRSLQGFGPYTVETSMPCGKFSYYAQYIVCALFNKVNYCITTSKLFSSKICLEDVIDMFMLLLNMQLLTWLFASLSFFRN
jgi:hypothetical protein